MLLVSLGVLGWLSWISYALFWARSRMEADRGARGLLSGVGSVLRFSLAQLSVLALWMLVPWGEEHVWRDSGPWVLASLMATSFALWAAGKLALCREAERQRRKPRFPPGLGGLLAVVVAALSLRWGSGCCAMQSSSPSRCREARACWGPWRPWWPRCSWGCWATSSSGPRAPAPGRGCFSFLSAGLRDRQLERGRGALVGNEVLEWRLLVPGRVTRIL